MTEVRFHRALYPGECVDEALKVYERYGKLERAEDSEHWVVRVRAKSTARERQLAGEIGNYALCLSVKRNQAHSQ